MPTLVPCLLQEDPGPGHYEAERRPATVATVTRPPFGVSVSRADKRSQRFFLGTNVSVVCVCVCVWPMILAYVLYVQLCCIVCIIFSQCVSISAICTLYSDMHSLQYNILYRVHLPVQW